MLSQYLQQLVDYIGNHPTAALAVIFLIAAGEAIFILGLFVPSTVVLVGAGTLIGMGKLDFASIFAAAALGAIAGDAISYWIGRAYKERIRTLWPFSRYTGLLDRGEAYFARHGGKSVFIGRFIPGIKAVVPGVAGMVGMSPARFSAINVISAIAWTASHLLPGIGLGRGIDVANSGNPRLVELLLIVLALSALAWYAAKFSFRWLLPHAQTWRWRLVDALSRHRGPVTAAARNLIANERNVLIPFTYATLAVLALFGFAALAVAYLVDPTLARSDAAISTYLQSLRTPIMDSVMVAVTMVGDGVMLTPLAVTIVAVFLWHRRWWIGASIVVACIGAALFVPLAKIIIHRSRPVPLYSGADSFSFPSGHAAMAATIIGIVALVAAWDLRPRARHALYFAAAIAIALIAFSRLYLLAHWPSDVGAGVLFGISLVFVLALLLHGRSLAPVSRRAGLFVMASFFIVYPLHLISGFDTASRSYAVHETKRSIANTQWLSGDWNMAPQRRILLDGEFGEPIVLQTDIDMAALIDHLTSLGWSTRDVGPMAGMIDSILPSKAALPDMSVLPLTNGGRPPLAVFTHSALNDAEKRIVLRVWPSDILISNEGQSAPLLLLSLTAEKRAFLAFGYALIEDAAIDDDEMAAVMSAIADDLRQNATFQTVGPNATMLLSRP